MKSYNIKKVKYIIVIILVLTFSLSYSQITEEQRRRIDRDKENFEKVFNQEFNIPKRGGVSFRDRSPAKLPDWFKKFTANGSGKYSIGISDPGMDTVPAIHLAITRAKALLGLYNRPLVEGVNDYYSNKSELKGSGEIYLREKYVDFCKIKTSFKIDTTKLKVEKIAFTKYNEAIVLVNYAGEVNETAGEPFKVNGSVFMVESQMGRKTDYSAKFDLDIRKNNRCLSHYEIQEEDNRYRFLSKYMGHEVPFTEYYFGYLYYAKNTSGVSMSYKAKVPDGLWRSFIKQIMRQMLNLAQVENLKIKKVDDVFGNTSSGDKNNYLIREVFKKDDIHFSLNSIEFKDYDFVVNIGVR